MNPMDKYENIKYLGKGAFGIVRLYQDKLTKEKVAIKIINKKKIIDKQYEAKIIRELNILQNIHHINIIDTKQILNDSKNIYIIMEYCEKGELFDHIVDRIFLEEDEASYYFYQLIKGIEYLHKNGIVHRDLKPENLLITKNNILKITDFGLSNYYDKNNALSTPCGSIGYTSPEKIYGKNYDGIMADIWSTGIILFEMLCGFLPFDDTNIQILYKKILRCKIEYPHNLTDDSRDLIKKILVKNPEKRITIKEIKKHKIYLKGKEIFRKINPNLFGEVEKKNDSMDNINIKKIETDNTLDLHFFDPKNKSEKTIIVKNRSNITKIRNKSKSMNNNKININENKAVSSVNKNKIKRKINLYNNNKTKFIEKNKINTTNNNNKKVRNKNYKNIIYNSLIKKNNNRIINIFNHTKIKKFGILKKIIHSKYNTNSNINIHKNIINDKSFFNDSQTKSNSLDFHIKKYKSPNNNSFCHFYEKENKMIKRKKERSSNYKTEPGRINSTNLFRKANKNNIHSNLNFNKEDNLINNLKLISHKRKYQNKLKKNYIININYTNIYNTFNFYNIKNQRAKTTISKRNKIIKFKKDTHIIKRNDNVLIKKYNDKYKDIKTIIKNNYNKNIYKMIYNINIKAKTYTSNNSKNSNIHDNNYKIIRNTKNNKSNQYINKNILKLNNIKNNKITIKKSENI